MNERVLLDTHAWIWLVSNQPGLRHGQHLADLARVGHLYLSPISCWELGLLVSRGRLKLDSDCAVWVRESIEKARLRIAPLSPDIAVAASYLPGTLHQDPADRLLIATVRQMGAVLATRDRLILDYASRGYLRVLEI